MTTSSEPRGLGTFVVNVSAGPGDFGLDAFFISTGVVALAEIGDKTQLLALLLATRFRKPIPIVLGILVATLVNHAFAGAAGNWLTQQIGATTMRWILGIFFLAMAVWTLVPDGEPEDRNDVARFGVFVTTLIAFFLVEMGDKTQIATVALAARFPELSLVVIGTTAGMMLANVPTVVLGERAAHRLPLSLIRAMAAALFVALGIYVLTNG